MSILVIASSAADYNNLVRNGFLKDIKNAFDATKLAWCNTADCLRDLAQVVDYILYFNSFKELSYEKVRTMAAASSTVDNVYGVEIKENKIWLYDNGVIADCIEHDTNIGIAIKNTMNRYRQLVRLGDMALTICVAIIFAVLIASYIDKIDDRTVYAQPQQQETQQVEEKEDNARLPLFFVE